MIILNDLLNIKSVDYSKWTICLNNAPEEQIYSFTENKERLLEHISWKKGIDRKQSFRKIDTDYCLQFLRLDKDQKYDRWLFLGAFQNNGVKISEDGHEIYKLELIEDFSQYIERLIINYKKHKGDKQAKIPIEKLNTLEVIKILEKPYIQTSRLFEGYDKVSLSFLELTKIVKANIDSWREALSHVQCIYVITDTKNGKLYIGSTYGDKGIWQRWTTYVETNGTGNNVNLQDIISKDKDYALKYFQFSILEPFFNVDGNSQFILDRENYWKNVFKTKEFGYNEN